MLLGLLVLLVAVLLTFIIVSLARKKARIRQQMAEVEKYTLALEQAERSKSEFVANLSHELRTPITGMLGMMDWLLETSLSEWQHRDLLDAKTCAVEAIGLLNSVLDLAKLQSSLSEWQHRDLLDAKTCAVEAIGLLNSVLDLAKLQVGHAGELYPTRPLVQILPFNTTPLPCYSPPTRGNESDSFPEPEPWMLHPPIPHPLTAEACRKRRRAEGGGEAGEGGEGGGGGGTGGTGRRSEGGQGRSRRGRRRGVGRVQLVMACEDTGCGIPWEEMRWVLDPEGHGEFVQEEEMNAYIQPADPASSTTTHAPSKHTDSPTALSILRSLPGTLLRSVMGGGDDSASGKARGGKGFQDAWTPYPVRFLLSASLCDSCWQGCAGVSYARALAAGFADTLLQPCLVTDLAQCLHALFAPIDQSDNLSDTSTNHVAPADPSSVSSLAPSTPPRPKSPQFRSKAALALAKPEDAAALLKEMLSGREVMVVDDNAVNRMVARKTLQGLGAKVELVESGEKALERLSAPNEFAVLLIDLHMPPGIDGYETARRIRAQYQAETAAPAAATTTTTSTSSSSGGSNGSGSTTVTSSSLPKLQSQPSFAFHPGGLPLLDLDAPAAAAAAPTAPAGAAAAAAAVAAPAAEEKAPSPARRQLIFSLTADVDARVRQACKEAGMDFTLSKPIAHQELLSAFKAAGVALL
ncbi:unnamed protein product [Closterium sp. Naga37s-1]|nr:unnamed protein product [Closterium sp. Naga37s-1]